MDNWFCYWQTQNRQIANEYAYMAVPASSWFTQVQTPITLCFVMILNNVDILFK